MRRGTPLPEFGSGPAHRASRAFRSRCPALVLSGHLRLAQCRRSRRRMPLTVRPPGGRSVARDGRRAVRALPTPRGSRGELALEPRELADPGDGRDWLTLGSHRVPVHYRGCDARLAARRLPGALLSASSACTGQPAACSGRISCRSRSRNRARRARDSIRGDRRRHGNRQSSWAQSCRFGSVFRPHLPDDTQGPAVSLLCLRSAVWPYTGSPISSLVRSGVPGHDGKRDLVRDALGPNLAALGGCCS